MNGHRLMNECPTVIGMMTSVVQSGGSIDTAIRDVAEEGPNLSKSIFQEVVRLADSKGTASLSEGLSSRMVSLPEEAAGYGRSVLMILSAAESADLETRDRMLRDASDSALESIAEMGESYGASLTIPCMMIFGIGIMVPMILMSILPMLSIGGMFGSTGLDRGMLMIITLAAVPSCLLMMTLYIRNRNPFLRQNDGLQGIRMAIPLMISIPLALVYMFIGGDIDFLFLAAFTPACVITALLMSKSVHSETCRRKNEQSLMDTVFDIGNRMLSGFNFEKASVDAISSNESCRKIADSLEREYSLCRGDVRSAIRQAIDSTSAEVSSSLCSIASCSAKDPNDASRLAITLGRQMQSRNVTKRNIGIKLKSTTDMMLGTAMIFAPLVLGMSVSMLEPLSRMNGGFSFEGTAMMMNIYLVELSALISILISSLGEESGIRDMIWRFCLICPVSLLTFAACKIVQI